MFGMLSPYFQQGQQMTPGAGMPPNGHAPMSMQRPQMGPPGQVPPMPMGGQQQPQQPMNMAQMGMLGQMLARQTQQPGKMNPAAGAMGAGMPQGIQGYLQQIAPEMFGPNFNWG